MKKVIACFLVFIFMFSALPVRELGKMLAKNQLTEEVHSDDGNSDDGDGLTKVKKEVDDEFTAITPINETEAVGCFNRKVHAYILQVSILPEHYVPSIPTPPPDFS